MKNLSFPGNDVIYESHFAEGVILVFNDNKTVGCLSRDEDCYYFNTSSDWYNSFCYDSLKEALQDVKFKYPNAVLKLFN